MRPRPRQPSAPPPEDSMFESLQPMPGFQLPTHTPTLDPSLPLRHCVMTPGGLLRCQALPLGDGEVSDATAHRCFCILPNHYTADYMPTEAFEAFEALRLGESEA